jgi:hypothetical protein
LLKVSARNDARDVGDLWRCLEIAAADGVEPTDFDDPSLQRVRAELWRQLGPDGAALSMLAADLQPDAARASGQVRRRMSFHAGA